MSLMKRKAIFLDRDGTVVENVGYAHAPDQMKLLPGAADAVAEFRRRGYLVVLITNQSGIGRGYFSEADLHAMHDKLGQDMADAGAELDGIYYCPHSPVEDPQCGEPCPCRKPKPGMLLKASKDLEIALAASYMVGDSPCDVRAGNAAGCRTGLLVSPGVDPESADRHGADFVVNRLMDIPAILDGHR